MELYWIGVWCTLALSPALLYLWSPTDFKSTFNITVNVVAVVGFFASSFGSFAVLALFIYIGCETLNGLLPLGDLPRNAGLWVALAAFDLLTFLWSTKHLGMIKD